MDDGFPTVGAGETGLPPAMGDKTPVLVPGTDDPKEGIEPVPKIPVEPVSRLPPPKDEIKPFVIPLEALATLAV